MTSRGKSLLCFALIILVSGITWALKVSAQTNPDKIYTVTLPLKDWQKTLQSIDYIKSRLRQSDLPAREVSYISDSLIDGFLTPIVNQLNRQLQMEQRQDSVNHKK